MNINDAAFGFGVEVRGASGARNPTAMPVATKGELQRVLQALASPTAGPARHRDHRGEPLHPLETEIGRRQDDRGQSEHDRRSAHLDRLCERVR
jgi:hypothetical protein